MSRCQIAFFCSQPTAQLDGWNYAKLQIKRTHKNRDHIVVASRVVMGQPLFVLIGVDRAVSPSLTDQGHAPLPVIA